MVRLVNILLLLTACLYMQAQEAYWLGDNSGVDETANGHTLTAYNGAGYSATAVQGTHSLNVDNAEGNYFSPGSFTLGDGGLTISLSFQNYNGSGVRTLFDQGGLKIYCNLSSKSIGVETDNGSLVDYATSNSALWTAGDWVHVGVRFIDVDGGYASVWVNGNNVTSDSTVRTDWTQSGTIYIGNSTEGSQTFYGKIDNVSVYRCAVSNDNMFNLDDNKETEYTVTCVGGGGGTPITGSKIYFSNSGNDANDGSTPALAKSSVSAMQTALNGMEAGDTLFLECGSVWNTVALNCNGLTGTSTAPIVITSYGTGNKPVLKGTTPITGWTYIGSNLWNKTDARIQGKKDHYIDSYTGSYDDHGTYTYFLGNIFVGGNPYYVGRYPNGTNSLRAETADGVNNDDITDSDASWTANQWQGGHVMLGQNDWIRTKAEIYSNSSNNIVFNSSDVDYTTWGNLANGLAYQILNYPNTLDQNGEYYHNYASNEMYIYWNQAILPTVEIPTSDSVINFQACSYMVLDGVNVKGSRVWGVKVRGGSNITITNCEASYCGYIGIGGTGYTGLTITSNNSHHNNINTYSNDGTNTYIGYNTLKYAGVDGTLDDYDIIKGNNIMVNEYNGTTLLEYNYCDSSNYSGITMRDYTSRSSPGFIQRYNLIQHWGMVSSDVGGTYIVSNDDNTEKLIYNNFLFYANTYTGWELGQGIVSGIYIDNVSRYTRVENNLVFEVPAEIFINYDGDNTTMLNNTIVRPALADNQYARGGLYADWAQSSSNMTFTGNLVVSHSAATPVINWNGYDNGGSGWEWVCSGCSFSGNKYVNPYTTNIFRHREEWTNEQNLTLAQWQSATGMDMTSTYKTLSVYNYTFANWSPTAHGFNLGTSAIYQDYDGTVYSGTLTLAPYEHKVLFYISGDRTGLISGLYASVPMVPDEEPEPPVVPVGLRRYLNGAEQETHLNGTQQNIFIH
jgi:hypothetical protein